MYFKKKSCTLIALDGHSNSTASQLEWKPDCFISLELFCVEKQHKGAWKECYNFQVMDMFHHSQEKSQNCTLGPGWEPYLGPLGKK